jgi:hypothetical protein
MPKPTDSILTWVSVLDPDDELAARLALCRLNSWCRDDPAWIRRIEKLSDKLIKTDADRENYTQRSCKIAREIKQASQAMRTASGAGSDNDPGESSAAVSGALTAALRE